MIQIILILMTMKILRMIQKIKMTMMMIKDVMAAENQRKRLKARMKT